MSAGELQNLKIREHLIRYKNGLKKAAYQIHDSFQSMELIHIEDRFMNGFIAGIIANIPILILDKTVSFF